MIRCSHCGKLAPAGATSCQSCGMPLTAAHSGASMAGMGQAEQQQELPAWLESLRAHERPVASGSGGQPFTAAELVDENAMPSWMRQDQSAETGLSDAFPAVAPGASFAGQTIPDSGMEASSLIDERSLPSWMRGAQESAQPADGQGFAAQSLVQPEVVPAWMKDLAPTTEPQTPARAGEEHYGLPAQATSSPAASMKMPSMPQASAQGFQASDLVDQQAMPEWLKNVQGASTSGSSFSAGALVDQRALPGWMKDQQGQEKSNPVSAMGVPVSGSGQGTGMGMGESIQGGVGMPASTFIDNNALPAWMSEGAQGGAGANFDQGMSAGSLIDVNAMPSWMSEGAQNAAGAGAPQGTQQAGGMSAGSLVDMNAMPAWMRTADNTQQGSGARGGPARASVPSRPRVDSGAQGQSEAAANVFASMLGVSAATPLPQAQTPVQENTLGVAPGPARPQQVQPVTPSWQMSPQPIVPPTPQNWQGSNSQPPLDNRMGSMPMSSPLPSPIPPSPLAPSQPAGMGAMHSYPGSMGMPDASRPGLGSSALGVGHGNSEEAEGTKKKGFFDAIRNFFFN